jgi:hypothetical protein
MLRRSAASRVVTLLSKTAAGRDGEADGGEGAGDGLECAGVGRERLSRWMPGRRGNRGMQVAHRNRRPPAALG